VVKLCGDVMNGSSPLSRGTLSGAIVDWGIRDLIPGDVNRERVLRNDDRRFPIPGDVEESNGNGGRASDGNASRSFECKELISAEERVRVR
jgi:hypothetical protein